MFELNVIGEESTQQFTIPLIESQVLKIGRSSQCEISVPWDRAVSRVHAELTLSHGYGLVRKLDAAQNPLIFKGKESSSINVRVNEVFQIGNTTFRLTAVASSPQAPPTDAAVNEYTFAAGELRNVPFVQTQGRSLELLATIPQLMRESSDDAAFAAALVGLILDAVPRCSAAAVVMYDNLREQDGAEVVQEPSLMRWNSRDEGQSQFRPSRRLMATAIRSQQSVLHIWDAPSEQQVFTNAGNLDWAFCSPVTDESSRGWCLYLSGVFDSLRPAAMKAELQEPMRFTELMAQFIGAARSIRMLQKTQTRMSSFFPPAVVRTITNNNADDMLRPRVGRITALFCDLRGFSKKTEQSQGDLSGLLTRISAALSVMVRATMENGGVVADFQGDAILSFWGWPQPADDGPLLACRAAMEIRRHFAEASTDATHFLHGLSIGIGIGTGTGIAGQIGPPEQSKVGVFGSVVNQASRLQGMTKLFSTPVLIDEVTAEVIRERGARHGFQCRRIARVQPRGMDTVLTISQLLCPEDTNAGLTEDLLARHEQAVTLFIAGQWKEAEDIFQSYLAEDKSNALLRNLMARTSLAPPATWDGTVVLRAEE